MTKMRRATLALLALTLSFGAVAASAGGASATAVSGAAVSAANVAAAQAQTRPVAAPCIGLANRPCLAHLQSQTAGVLSDITDFGVRVVPGSKINLVSSQSRLPIKIRNDYQSDVRVFVWTQPDSLWITMPKATEVTVPAMTTITATVPIEAISNGNSRINVYLTSFTGVRMGTSTWMKINVERDIEPAILATFFVVVGVLGAIGARRMVRRRRGASE